MIPNKTQESQGGQRRIFFAEKVLDKRGRGRKAEYLIKWLAREEKATWERRENCWLPTMISNFEEERKLAARNKKEKKRLAKNVKIQTNSRYNGRVAYVGRGAGKVRKRYISREIDKYIMSGFIFLSCIQFCM